MFYSILECSKPVIAAVKGAALGAGMALVLCCDIILASEDAIFGMPEVDVGLAGGVEVPAAPPQPVEGAAHAAHRPARARARALPARCARGMRRRRRDLMPKAMALAAEIASKSPLAVRMLKESFNAVENLTLRDGYRLEQNMTVALSRTDDAREAREAFVEKRKPVFKGR